MEGLPSLAGREVGKRGRGSAGHQKLEARPLAQEDQSRGPFPCGALTLFSTPRARRGIIAKQPSRLLLTATHP